MIRPPQVSLDAITLRLTVPPQLAGVRLDRFLCTRLGRLSRTRIQRIIRSDVFTPEGRPLRPSWRTRAGADVVVYREPFEEPAVPRDFGVPYEDDDVIVIDKPAGLPVHPSGRFHRHTLAYLLRERFPDERVVICHRLDRETSGVLLCARSRTAESALKRQFQERRIDKVYLAIVHGTPDPPEGVVTLPLVPEPGGPLRVRMRIGRTGEGLAAETRYRVVGTSGALSLLHVEPRTGRQHQIRAHLSAIGHPVAGDKLYLGDGEAFIEYLRRGTLDPRLVLARQALHAHRISFEHPSSRERLEISSPLPADMASLLGDTFLPWNPPSP